MTVSAEQMPPDTTAAALDVALAAAAEAAPALARLGGDVRAEGLRAVARALAADADDLVRLAEAETRLGEQRLRGELARTTFQLDFFADLLLAGDYLQVTLDRPDPDWPPGARPDLRRLLLPIGPALVFAASNFPFAFSVAGGDTVSALGAGCPVILKASPGHPRLSARTGRLVRDALEAAGAPPGTFAVVFGLDAGSVAIGDPRVKVASFTGSQQAGRALLELATARPDPIPFYGELGSVNPVFVTRKALERRRDAIVEGFVDSFTLGTGQFCTKPGVLLVPAGEGVEEQVASLCGLREGTPMLDDRLREAYVRALEALAGRPGVSVVRAGTPAPEAVASTVLTTQTEAFLDDLDSLAAECFGPASLLVLYDDDADLVRVAERLDGQLTATVHGEEDDEQAAALLERLARVAGRVVWNGWPTGVAVTWAMQHGGPWPASTAPSHTSVGSDAIHRFLRPLVYQNVPDALLPPALREANPLELPRRVDGNLVPAPVGDSRGRDHLRGGPT